MLKNVNTFPANASQITPRPRPPPPWGASPPCPLPPKITIFRSLGFNGWLNFVKLFPSFSETSETEC